MHPVIIFFGDNMEKKSLIIALCILCLILVACSAKTYKRASIDSDKSTKVRVTPGKDSWCPAGGNWDMSTASTEGMVASSCKVDKIIASGKYKGLCHVICSFNSAAGQTAEMEYYFSEDGKSGYYLAEVNGQKIETEWNP